MLALGGKQKVISLGKPIGGLVFGVLAALFFSATAPEALAAGGETNGAGFAYYCDQDPAIPRAVYVVKIDRSRQDLALQLTLGGNSRIGMATLLEQAKFIPPEIGQPLAGINGDYFEGKGPLVGAPLGLCIRRGELITPPGEDRAFFYLDAQGNPHLTNAISKFQVSWPDGQTTPIGLNQALAPTGAVLYTEACGASTRAKGLELILTRHSEGPWLPLRIGQELKAKVRQVNVNGDSPLTADTLVLALGPRAPRTDHPAAPGDILKLSLATTPDLTGATLAMGGGPSLVREGKARPFDGLQPRHPRSAIGWGKDFFYFVQVDGRQVRHSMGMSLPELANYFVKLGCDYALNLDGGASSTTWINGQVVNRPCGRFLRPFGNALLLVRKPAMSGGE